jgi:hypothetical protein
VEGLKAADLGHVLLDPEMIALDPLLQGLGDGVERIARQEAARPRRHDSGRVRIGAICADPVRGQQRLILEHLTEKALGCVQIALRSQQEVDGRAVLVDGPVQISPLTTDLDVRFVDAN